MLYFTTLPRRKSTIALISYLFGLFVYPFLKFVLGYHNASADPQCGKTLRPCQLISPGTGDSQHCCHLWNREHQRQIFIRFECFFFHSISFLLSRRGRGFYLIYFVLLIYFFTIRWRESSAGAAAWPTGVCVLPPLHGHTAPGLGLCLLFFVIVGLMAQSDAQLLEFPHSLAVDVQPRLRRNGGHVVPEDIAHVVEQSAYRQQELRLVPLTFSVVLPTTAENVFTISSSRDST